MRIGEVYEIPHTEGATVQGRLLEMWEDEDYEWFKFDILDNGGVFENGEDDPDHRYIVDYCQIKRPEYSGIEKNTNMPIAYAGKIIEDFNWSFYPGGIPDQRKMVMTFMGNFKRFLEEGKGLYIHSRTRGSGKTLLACCIGTDVMRKNIIRVKYVNCADYIQKVYNKEADEFLKATLLILDDIGVQDDSKRNAGTILYDLVNYRYSNHLPTIFTSNLDIDSCSDDDRITQRVYEMAMLDIRLPEVSVRKMLADRAKKAFMESLGVAV